MTDEGGPIADPADETQAWDLEKLKPEAWEGYRKFVDEYFARVGKRSADTGDEHGDEQHLGYEIREYHLDEPGRSEIEAWLPGRQSPLVRAVPRSYSWLVLVERDVAVLAGVGDVHLTALEAISHAEALTWVRLLAALYVKAAAK